MKDIICKIFLLIFFIYCSDALREDRYYPRYHLAPPHGWMNDPNGFCIFNDEYHMFYQYNPYSSQNSGIVHWGHAKSKDLFHWEHLGIAMYPDQPYDNGGVFSGSGLVENNTMYLFYTGNVNKGDGTIDHEYQALATSTDGVNIVKYDQNPIIIAADKQPHIRDPKVWKHDDKYYMVLGNSFENYTLGRILLYVSNDKINWDEASILIKSDGFLGYMLECPDLFPLGDYFVLIFSPQGMKPEGDKYKNLYQTGYVVGKLDYNTNVFTPLTKFKELDHGHDFYATQTTEDHHGRRLLVSWLDMWETNYPEKADGFSGQLSIVRELKLVKKQLIQNPVKEVLTVRGPKLYSGPVRGSKSITLRDKSGEVRIQASPLEDLTVKIESNNSSATVFISYNNKNRLISLNRGGEDGIRRTTWKPVGKLNLRLFIDASSIELFCGIGEVTFSSRFFPEGDVKVGLGGRSFADNMEVYSIQRTVVKPE